MGQEPGLDSLVRGHTGKLMVTVLSELLLEDLKSCRCLFLVRQKMNNLYYWQQRNT
jgi:hypothetical protein